MTAWMLPTSTSCVVLPPGIRLKHVERIGLPRRCSFFPFPCLTFWPFSLFLLVQPGGKNFQALALF